MFDLEGVVVFLHVYKLNECGSMVGPRFGYVEMGYGLTKRITRGNGIMVSKSWGGINKLCSIKRIFPMRKRCVEIVFLLQL